VAPLRSVLAGFAVFAAMQAHAAFSGAILDASGVSKAIAKGAIVWDVRPVEKYFDGHIPGAVNIDDIALTLVDQKTQTLLPVETIAARLGEAGIDPKREIVVYGRAGSLNAYFVEWLLDYYGAKKVDVFHDGFEGWKAAGLRVTTDAARRKPVKVRPFANPSMWATTSEVIARENLPGVQFVDVRRFGEFNGDESETIHGGHIPGAVHIPYNLALADPDAPMKMMHDAGASVDMRLKSTAELRKVYAVLDPHKETIVYCHVGLRAAMTAAILTRLGFRSVRLYYPGWIEYGNEVNAPVE
jgi:thiosulfate/3-mercaptopyruvate sulfurtransferase